MLDFEYKDWNWEENRRLLNFWAFIEAVSLSYFVITIISWLVISIGVACHKLLWS